MDEERHTAGTDRPAGGNAPDERTTTPEDLLPKQGEAQEVHHKPQDDEGDAVENSTSEPRQGIASDQGGGVEDGIGGGTSGQGGG